MNILVINSGSSSIKFSLFRAEAALPEPQSLLEGELSAMGTASALLSVAGKSSTVDAPGPAKAIHLVLDAVIQPSHPAIDAIGYRVVHPGPTLDRHQRITPEVLAALDAAKAFAPLHDPEAVQLIREAMQRFPEIPHYACFDTVFHQTMPVEATTYPIPLAFHAQGVRRYGFHGLSCESVVRRLRLSVGVGVPFPQQMIIAHLGSGCSVTAVADGKSIDTTMGLTPTGGVVMGTRPGDLDPGLIFYLLRQPGATIKSVETMLNHNAGLKALGGVNDMRQLRDRYVQDRDARLAVDVFTTSIRRAIGGMAVIHGLSAIVFTGGIGEHDPRTRSSTATGLFGEQPDIDRAANEAKLSGVRKISVEDSNIPVYVVPAEENLMIALHVARLAAE